jgi:peptide/nickel transport system substrate-binding protein
VRQRTGRARPRNLPLIALRSLALGCVLALVAAACGTGGGGGATTEAGGGGSTENTLVIGMTATNIPLLDTGLSQNEGYEGIRFVGNQLYDGLTRFDLSDPDAVPQIVPALAESWDANEDLTQWTFTLRPGVTFHDGEPWDADAAIYNLDRYVNPSAPQFHQALNAQAGLSIGGIESFSKVDDMTIQINTKGPWSYLPVDLATVFFASPKAVEELGNDGFASKPVGTGPFEFVELIRGERLTLEKNESYWRGAPKVDKVILRPIPDPTARVAALRSGEVNWIEVPLPDDREALEAEGFTVHLNSYDH